MVKLNINWDTVDKCREWAESVVKPVQRYIDRHSTKSIERSVLRLLGFSGAHEVAPDHPPHPIANLIVDKIPREKLKNGVATVIAGIRKKHSRMPQNKMAELIIGDKINFSKIEDVPADKAQQILKPWVDSAYRQVDRLRYKKEEMRELGKSGPTMKYVIVATGNIYEDVKHAIAAARQGADVIAVIRSTAQSLLDYVPEGATTEGFGGTYATQENFRIMREALNEESRRLKRYVRLCNYSSGLCMPEIAVMGALEGLDFLLNDAMYGILFRDINMKRTFIDQYFSRIIIARAGIVINTGEDNYLTTADAYNNHHQVLASQFINEQFAKNAGLRDDLMGLGHAFEMDPQIEDSILYEIAMAQLVREIFPRAPIKYMPPTRHKQGDIFFSHVLDTVFNIVGAMTGQGIQLLGMCTEANHNPHMQDRFWALKNANYIFKAGLSLRNEITFSTNGKVMRRASSVLENTNRYLRRISRYGLFRAIEEGLFAEMPRQKEGGRGLDGVFERSRRYYNPFLPNS